MLSQLAILLCTGVCTGCALIAAYTSFKAAWLFRDVRVNRARIADLEDQLDAMDAKVKSAIGRIYRSRRTEDAARPLAAPVTPEEKARTKDQLRRRMGIVPTTAPQEQETHDP